MAEKPPIAVIWDGTQYRPADRESHYIAEHAYKPGARLNFTLTIVTQVEWDGQTFSPADMHALEHADRTFVQGARLEGKMTRPVVAHDRRQSQNRLYWAGLGFLVKNFDEEDEKRWPTSRHLHDAMLDALGYKYKLWRIDGTFKVEVDSVAFEKMDDADFDDLFEKVRAIVFRLWGWNPWDAWKAEKDAEAALKAQQRRQGP
jgi:hypothetical protein